MSCISLILVAFALGIWAGFGWSAAVVRMQRQQIEQMADAGYRIEEILKQKGIIPNA